MAYHKYQDAILLLRFDYAAALAPTGDSLVGAVITRSGLAALSPSGVVVGYAAVTCLVSGGTFNPVAPADPDQDYSDAVRCVATTANGQELEITLTVIMRQPGAVTNRAVLSLAEAREFTFDFSPAVIAPFNDPLVLSPAVPLVDQVVGDGALTIGTPALCQVGNTPQAGVRVLIAPGTLGLTYILRCLAYTDRGLRHQTNVALTITA